MDALSDCTDVVDALREIGTNKFEQPKSWKSPAERVLNVFESDTVLYHACTMRGSRAATFVVSRCKCLLGVAKCVGAVCAAIVKLCLRKVLQEKRKDEESEREKAGPVLRTNPCTPI